MRKTFVSETIISGELRSSDNPQKGAVSEPMKVWVFGASNIDIIARSNEPIIAADSNVGAVEKAPGGVGRNIAAALKALGFDVALVTAIADDADGRLISSELEKLGIKLSSKPYTGKDDRTGVYCCIMDGDGSLVCAVNDMKINRRLSPDLVKEYKDSLESCDYVVFEANLPHETIKALASLDVPLVADCVSTIKADKLADVLEDLYLLKANFAEASALAGIEGAEPDRNGLDRIMNALIAKGLRRAIISLGRGGAFCYEVTGTGTRGYEEKVIAGLNVVSTNGCGDVLLAAFLRSLAEGYPMDEALRLGQVASGLNSESMEAVSPQLSFKKVIEKAEEKYEQIS